MPRSERSAGVVLFRDDPHGERLFLLLDYGKHWDYPKGHVEKGEDDRAAALRELAEETGITDARLRDDFAHEIVYFFRHPKRGLIRKTVVFFLGQTDAATVTLSHEHEGYEFLLLDQALTRLTYSSAKAVLRAAAEHLAAHA